MNGIDLFSGARGWEALAHRTLGVDLLGIEHWEPAVLTSRAAGLRTLHADVSTLDPLDHAAEVGGACGDGTLVASPPCQGRSYAGRQLGALDVAIVAQCMMDLANGQDTRAALAPTCADERSLLTVEPLRWALKLMPRVVLLEQVPPVLPDWKLVGQLLGAVGYSWWAGILEAERYGVPQTRERAVLIARRDGVAAAPPVATHHRFVPNEPRPVASESLFESLLPWVSMAEALGWGMTERPCVTVAVGSGRQGGPDPLDGGAGSRATVRGERDRGAWRLRAGTNANDIARPANEPAPTMRFGARSNDVSWVHDRPAPTVVGTRRSEDGMPEGEGENVGGWGWNPRQNGATVRDGNEPAPTMLGEGLAKGVPVWDDEKNCPKAGPRAVRVTVEEAAVLQSFPPDWPWQGSRTAQFTQVGNAVPPLLGEALFRAVMEFP
jgi:DNA (cytosine-5)-methyltransferase 1